jgi:hypothetical protein
MRNKHLLNAVYAGSRPSSNFKNKNGVPVFRNLSWFNTTPEETTKDEMNSALARDTSWKDTF